VKPDTSTTHTSPDERRPRRLARSLPIAIALLSVVVVSQGCGGDGSSPCEPGPCGPVGEEALRGGVQKLPAGQEVYWLGPTGLTGDAADGSFPWRVFYSLDEGPIKLVTYLPGQVQGRDYTPSVGDRFLLRILPPGGESVEIYGGPDVTRADAERIADDLRTVPRD
jgi:hypothetical protein